MYEVIVLGATFAAAGIAQQYKEKCLVLERSARAGYEFFCAQGFLADAGLSVYPYFRECHTVFCTEICEVTQNDGYFLCQTHGVDGFRTYKAKKLIDTRCKDAMCVSKTFDLLVESEEIPVFPNTTWEQTEWENRYVLRCEVPLDCSYTEARLLAGEVVRSFSENQRLILAADEFDYHVKADYPKTEGGCLYMPSKAYASPQQAFQAGAAAGEVAGK